MGSPAAPAAGTPLAVLKAGGKPSFGSASLGMIQQLADFGGQRGEQAFDQGWNSMSPASRAIWSGQPQTAASGAGQPSMIRMRQQSGTKTLLGQ